MSNLITWRIRDLVVAHNLTEERRIFTILEGVTNRRSTHNLGNRAGGVVAIPRGKPRRLVSCLTNSINKSSDNRFSLY